MTHKAVNSYKSVVYSSKFTRVILPPRTCNFVMLLKTEKILETYSLTSCAARLRIQVFCQSKAFVCFNWFCLKPLFLLSICR